LATTRARTERVAIIGLDCAAPELLFSEWIDELPNIRGLIARGVHGELASIVPPITVPAWMSMMTSQDPGSLGIYGFRNRRDHSYGGLFFASGSSVKQPTLWDVLGKNRRDSIVMGVPPTYPPKAIRGSLVSCFLTPDTNRPFTYPTSLGAEIHGVADGYMLDVAGFRRLDRSRLLAQLHAMMDKRFRAARHLVETKPWDLFAMVEIGVDRLHHAFWRYWDPTHRLHEPDSPFASAMHDYYVALDAHIGSLVESLGEDTTVFIVSDHGAKRMDGGICINEWLIANGYLTLKSAPEEATRLRPDMVDWANTRAWGDGGYYGRVFINVAGREPEGCVQPEAADALLDELIAGLEALGDERGRPIGTRVHRPSELYARVEGIAPDLIALFGGLHWRSLGSVGGGSVHAFENDTGPDDANHAENGVLIAAGPGIGTQSDPVVGMSLLDVAPTVLELYGFDPLPEHQGSSLVNRFDTGEAFTALDEETIAERLEELGYL
jgi:predicted AlkP superfamily phosphohydrolase/phosphomutase